MRISFSAAIGVTGHEPHQSRSGSDIRVINRNASIRGQTARITHLQVEVNARAYLHGRIVRSILLEEPDRIPLSLNIRPEPYEQLMATLGVSDKGMKGHIEVVKSLNVDIIGSGLGLKGGHLPADAERKEGPYGSAYTIGFKEACKVRKDL